MDQNEQRQQWRLWIEHEIGGPEARVETATQAAMAAIVQRKSRDEVIAAARQAANSWSMPGNPAAPGIGGRNSSTTRATQRTPYNSTVAPAAPTGAKTVWRTTLIALLGVVTVATTLYFTLSIRHLIADMHPIRGRSYVSTYSWAAGLAFVIDVAAVLMMTWLWRQKSVWSQDQSSSLHPNITSRGKTILGRVSALQQRQELAGGFERISLNRSARYIVVWNFRLERSEPDGRPLPPVAVEMRGLRIDGFIVNGDEVEVDTSSRSGGNIIRAREIRVLSSNSVVRARTRSIGTLIFKSVYLFFFAIVIIVFIYLFFHAK